MANSLNTIAIYRPPGSKTAQLTNKVAGTKKTADALALINDFFSPEFENKQNFASMKEAKKFGQMRELLNVLVLPDEDLVHQQIEIEGVTYTIQRDLFHSENNSENNSEINVKKIKFILTPTDHNYGKPIAYTADVAHFIKNITTCENKFGVFWNASDMVSVENIKEKLEKYKVADPSSEAGVHNLGDHLSGTTLLDKLRAETTIRSQFAVAWTYFKHLLNNDPKIGRADFGDRAIMIESLMSLIQSAAKANIQDPDKSTCSVQFKGKEFVFVQRYSTNDRSGPYLEFFQKGDSTKAARYPGKTIQQLYDSAKAQLENKGIVVGSREEVRRAQVTIETMQNSKLDIKARMETAKFVIRNNEKSYETRKIAGETIMTIMLDSYLGVEVRHDAALFVIHTDSWSEQDKDVARKTLAIEMRNSELAITERANIARYFLGNGMYSDEVIEVANETIAIEKMLDSKLVIAEKVSIAHSVFGNSSSSEEAKKVAGEILSIEHTIEHGLDSQSSIGDTTSSEPRSIMTSENETRVPSDTSFEGESAVGEWDADIAVMQDLHQNIQTRRLVASKIINTLGKDTTEDKAAKLALLIAEEVNQYLVQTDS